jgi:transcriptional regulator with XRE-family HTH domain
MSFETVLATETDPGDNRLGVEIAARLREVIADGDAADVSRRSGVPYASLRAYMNGRQPKAAALVALARAAGVRIEWLMTGDGPVRAEMSAPAGLAEAAAGYRSASIEPDVIDVANLAWALDFVEKTAAAAPGMQRVALMLSAASEFRRVQRMPPLPPFQEPILAAALDAAEQLLRAAEQPCDPGRRVSLMLSIYGLVVAPPGGA